MNLSQLIEHLRHSPMWKERVTTWYDTPSRPAQTAPFPGWVHPDLVEVLKSRGVEQLYTHQHDAIQAVHRGEHVVVVTPTASGKTLCYNLPILNTILEDPDARALYLFPTKALAQDQLANLHEISTALNRGIKTFTYDGDTAPSARKLVRTAGHVVISNPDMLHTGVLPHHTKWVRLFENLRYIVIDELHNYRGVFGSHVANLMRRLIRICKFYGSNPQFICASATIGNPGELASRVLGIENPDLAPEGVSSRRLTTVSNNGAPQGPKTFLFYNPPVINKELGIRRSALLESTDIASQLLANDIQTVVFGRTRQTVEVLLSYLRESYARRRQTINGRTQDVTKQFATGTLPASTVRRSPTNVEAAIRGYRGGYLPTQRREIERGLRDGTVRTVVSTNALELGVDIGALEAAILVGYPGTVASMWQQAGRAGRRNTQSLAVMVAGSSPLDQYVVNNPEYFFERSPENGLINPDNLYILMSHIQCAAFELAFHDDEAFGTHPASETMAMLAYLEESMVVHHASGMWHWSSENFPAENISLRTAASENFVIIDTSNDSPRIIGEMDRFSVLTMLHEDAIYLHEGQQYHVDKLEWEEQKAYVRTVDADYYTDAELVVSLKILEVTGANQGSASKAQNESADDIVGAVHAPDVSTPSSMIRGHGDVMVTAQPTIYKKIKLGTHDNVGWGKIHLPEQELHTTAYWLCIPPEVAAMMPTKVALESGLTGLANVLGGMSPLYLMCDPRDLGVVPQIKNPFTNQSTIFIYDTYPGGIGFSKKLYELHITLLEAAGELIRACPCVEGCPSCVGPAMQVGFDGKLHAQVMIDGLLGVARAA